MSSVHSRTPQVGTGQAGQGLLNRTSVRCVAILLFLGLLVVPASIPFRVLLLACAALGWTVLATGSLKPLGLARSGLRVTLASGIGIAVAVTVLGEISQPLIDWALGIQSDYSAYGALAGDAGSALRLLGFALISAAFAEEVLFRGFLLYQLSAILGTGDAARWASIIFSGAIFGLAHAIQGPLGVVSTGLVGMVFGWAWFRTGRNLWALMLAHALVDTYGIGMLYLGRFA